MEISRYFKQTLRQLFLSVVLQVLRNIRIMTEDLEDLLILLVVDRDLYLISD